MSLKGKMQVKRVANNALSTLSGIDVQVTNEVTVFVCVTGACPREDGTACGDADGTEGEQTTSFGRISFRVFGYTSLQCRKRLSTSSNDSGNDFMIQN